MKQIQERGFVLVTTMMMLGLLLALLSVYYGMTSLETASVRFARGSTSGFYSAEAGLNVRAESIRQVFVGFNRPTGTSPTTTNPCGTGNTGSGDFICRSYTFNNRSVNTYVTEDAGNPVILTIPPGERYQYLNAQEYRYTAKSTATNNIKAKEADLELRFRSRLVPLFQFAAFYNKDLEILPGPTMTLSGPVHTNGDLYLYSNSATLTISGQVTAAGDVYRGRKDNSISPNCSNQQVYVYDPASPRSLIPNCPTRYKVQNSDITPFNGMIQQRVQAVTVPGPDVFDPTTGHIYWDHADLRLVLALDASENVTGIQVRNTDDTNNATATTALLACAGNLGGKAVKATTGVKNWRENVNLILLDVDLQSLFNCLKTTNWFTTGKQLDDATDGGLVFHMTVKGPNSGTFNRYGIRLQYGSKLQSSIVGAPVIKGLTVVSDQAAYIKGDFNSISKIPAAVMADSLNEMSNNWNDANAAAALSSRVATSTTYNAAFLAGTDTTGGNEGPAGQGGAYNGGLENYPRLHENWSGLVNTYRGSFVSLGKPLHARGGWSSQSYNPPNRDWNYDTSFNNAANLPPITPRFVYLKQELFVRNFQ